MHAKTIVVDDVWAAVGSDNLNRRSWTNDSELSCAILDEERDEREPRDPAGTGRWGTFVRAVAAADPAQRAPAARRSEANWWIRRQRSIELDGPPMRSMPGTRAASKGHDPAGRLRHHRLPAVHWWERWWTRPVYSWLVDPDGRPPDPASGRTLLSSTATQHNAHQPHPSAKPAMTSEYQWTPSSTLDHATTIATVTAPMHIGPPNRRRSIARQHDGDRGVRRCGGGGVPTGERTEPMGVMICESVGRGRSTTAFTSVVQHDLAHGGGQQERHRPWTPGTNERKSPTALASTSTVVLAPSCVRNRKMATRSLLKAAAQVAIGRSKPAVPWFDDRDPQGDHDCRRRPPPPRRRPSAPRERIARCLPFAEKEKPPPCERTTRPIGWAGASRAIIRRRSPSGSP